MVGERTRFLLLDAVYTESPALDSVTTLAEVRTGESAAVSGAGWLFPHIFRALLVEVGMAVGELDVAVDAGGSLDCEALLGAPVAALVVALAGALVADGWPPATCPEGEQPVRTAATAMSTGHLVVSPGYERIGPSFHCSLKNLCAQSAPQPPLREGDVEFSAVRERRSSIRSRPMVPWVTHTRVRAGFEPSMVSVTRRAVSESR